jgi:hypothetical protein
LNAADIDIQETARRIRIMWKIESIVCALGLSLGQIALAATRPTLIDDLPQMKCARQVEAALQAQGASGPWIEQAPVVAGTPYRSPTLIFGTWVELIIRPDRLPLLFTAQNTNTLKFEFDEKCAATGFVLPGMDFSKASTSTYFNDEDLQKYIAKHKRGMIYVWSPGMVYSAKYFNHFKRVAKKLKLDFLPLVDPRARDAYTTKMSELNNIPRGQSRMNSVELYMRDMTIHYPTTILFKDSALVDQLILGVMEENTLEERVKYVLGNL